MVVILGRHPDAIVNRRYEPGPEIAACYPDTEFGTCSYCDRLLTQSYEWDGTFVCRTNVVFTDGACLNNGQADTSIPFDCSIGKRTNQRAELLGAYEGMIRGLQDMQKECPHFGKQHIDWGDRQELLIVTDSEYVTKAMTQWLPVWKANGMKNSSGQTPANLDIILHFDERIEHFARLSYKVGFKHVLRRRNELADKLSKRAAEIDVKLKRGMSRHNAFTTVYESSPDLAILQFVASFS